MAMLRKLIPAILMASLLLATAQASSLRIQGELIREGTPVTTMIRLIGPPEHRSVVYACPDGCAPDHEIWLYRVNDLNYRFRIRGGKVENVEWSRF
jgi:hypothetical protein